MANDESASIENLRSGEEWEGWMRWDDGADNAPKRSPCHHGVSMESETRNPSRKRKSRADEYAEHPTSTAVEEKRPTTSIRSHNIVERRYRSNINAKIADLRDSVPALKAKPDSSVQQPQNTDTLAQKLNKATILSTAVAYIHDLERDKTRLELELRDLRARLRIVERRDEERSTTPETDSPPSITTPVSQTATLDSSTSSSWENPVQGMIRVPEDMRRLRTASMQAQYAEQPYLACGQDGHSSSNSVELGQGGVRRARQVGKFMAGTFAGLMVAQGFGGKGAEEERHTKRSLSAIPDQSLWHKPWQISGTHPPYLSPNNLRRAIFAFEVFVCLFVFGFGIFLYAFCYKPKRRKQGAAQRTVSIPSLASPLEVRRNAWLTSIQIVRVPRHKMFPEWVAVNLEALHYVVRQVIGWHGYSWMTGQTEDDEIARVRAWDIAIDAQLMGGDAEISGSRLILTILASGTLQTTPSRLMLKALHLRVLLWKTSKDEKGTVRTIMHRVAALLAAHQWRSAQELQRALPPTSMQLPNDSENLPEHLTALLQLSCSEVLTDPIIQRAYNLAWSRPTQEDVTQTDLEMDLVVEDSTIRSPLDAICAWLSSSTLQRALFASLEDAESNAAGLEWDFGVALHTAPRASISQARALAANAVFVDANRQSALSMLSQDFLSTAISGPTNSTSSSSNPALFIDSSMPEAVGYDVTLASYCALALSKLENQKEGLRAIEEALEIVSLGYQNVKDLTWLSYAAAYRLIQTLTLKEERNQYMRLVAQILPRLVTWAESYKKSREALEQRDVHSGPSIQKAIDEIKRFMAEINDTELISSKLSVAGEVVRTRVYPEPLVTTNMSAEDVGTALPDKANTRRFSRASADSGYGSGEA